MEKLWRGYADDLSTAPIALAGHLPHEEQPEAVNQALLDFLGHGRDDGLLRCERSEAIQDSSSTRKTGLLRRKSSSQ